jgi:hypothetical protein
MKIGEIDVAIYLPNLFVETSKIKISWLVSFLFFFAHLFHQTYQALNLWLRRGKDAVQLLLGVMLLHKSFDIHLALPTTGYESAGEHVVLETAEPKIDFTPHPGASDRFVIVLLDQCIYPPDYKVHTQGLRNKPWGVYS